MRWQFSRVIGYVALAAGICSGTTNVWGQLLSSSRTSSTTVSDIRFTEPNCDALDSNLAGQRPQFDETFAATGDAPIGISLNEAAGGYMDNPIVGTNLRLRYDRANNNPLPDRAEFFYGQCGCYNPITPLAPGPGSPRPGVNGVSERRIDYQDFSAYLEMARSDYFSWFVEVPVRFLDPEILPNTSGLSDVNFGLRYALLAQPDEYLTFQFRVYTPTGDGDRGLGTAHFSLEPSLLYWYRWTDRLSFQAELRDWISLSDSINPFNGKDFSGNVVRYGLGLGYDLIPSDDTDCSGRLTAVAEFVGWSIIGGFATTPAGQTISTAGDSIVNAKLGARYTIGDSSLYAGYGRALSNDFWYEDILRLEWRRAF